MKVRDRVALAQSAAAEPEEIAGLASDSSAQVRRAVAARRDLHRDLLMLLAQDSDRQVRRAIAEHPNADDALLIALTDDPDFHVHWYAAQNRSGSAEFRMRATRANHRDVRWALAQLRPLEFEVAMELAQDSARQVREQLALATTHAQVLEVLIHDPDPRVRGTVAFNAGAAEHHFAALLHDRQAAARIGLASSPYAPLPMLMELLDDRSFEVRFALTKQMMHPDLLRALLDDPDELVSETAANSLRNSAL